MRKTRTFFWEGERLLPLSTGEGKTPSPTREGETPSPDPTPFGSYGASTFAPTALKLGAFSLHPRTLARGEVEVGGALSQFVPLKLRGIDATAYLL